MGCCPACVFVCVAYKKLVGALDVPAYIQEECLQTWQPSPAGGSPGHIRPEKVTHQTNTAARLCPHSVESNNKSFNPHTLPLLQIGQQHFAVAGDVLSSEDHHLTCGCDITDRSSLGVAFLDPQAHWDVVSLA